MGLFFVFILLLNGIQVSRGFVRLFRGNMSRYAELVEIGFKKFWNYCETGEFELREERKDEQR